MRWIDAATGHNGAVSDWIQKAERHVGKIVTCERSRIVRGEALRTHQRSIKNV